MANNNNNANPDMFSLLTDSLILIIISFLPFQESARTSVLSKRWRNLWRETKNIDLDENLFVKPNEQSSKETIEAQRRVFVDFATQWIRSYRPSTVDKFRLSLSHPHNHVMAMQQCVQFAIARSVKFLDLDFTDSTWNEERLDHDHDDALFELPTCVFEHQELLESLKLFSCKFRFSEFNNLSALKSLSLGWIELSGSSFRALLSNCRLLESLTLKKCRNLGYLDISAPRLRTLVIDKCLDLENGIRIKASKLRFFKYSGPLYHFMIEYLNDMVEADLDFGFEFEFSECGDILYELLRDICCIRVLTVCSYMLQVIPTAEEYPLLKPPLESVKHLTLKTALHVHEYHGISFFLNSCPHLEFLTIDIGPTRIFSERENSHALEEHEFLSTYKYIMVYGCILRSLRVVEIKGFKGAPNELMVIKYFLNYGLALEALYIGVSDEKGPPGGVDMDSSYRQNAEKLLQFRRASESLRIFIS